MERKPNNQKPQIFTKIAFAFLVFLCCAGAYQIVWAAVEFYPSDSLRDRAFGFADFFRDAAQMAPRQFVQGIAAVENEVFPAALEFVSDGGRDFGFALADAKSAAVDFAQNFAVKTENNATAVAVAAGGLVENSAKQTAGLGETAARSLARGVHSTGDKVSVIAGNVGAIAGKSLRAGAIAAGSILADLPAGANRAADGIFGGVSAALTGANRAVRGAIDETAQNMFIAADSILRAARPGTELAAKRSSQTAAAAGGLVENSAKQTAGLGETAARSLAQASQAGQASLSSFFDGIKNHIRDTARRWLGIEDSPGNDQLSMNGQISNDQEFLEDDQRVRPSENQPTPIVQNIYPEKEIQTKEVQTKEIQTIHTKEIQTQVNTVVADEGTKARVNQILRQMDSDRPNYSLGQSFNPPDNLGANTLDIGGGSFTVNRHGAITGGSLDIGSGNFTVSAGGDAVVRGNFTVSGSQTYSGAAAFSATTTAAVLSVIQGGSGVALQADNIAIKSSTISTNDSDTNLLVNPNGTGAVQFHTAANYIDSTGNLVLDGDITLTSGGTFYTTDNGNLVFAPNGTGNLVVGETDNAASIVPFVDSTLGYDLGSSARRWYDIYAAGKLDVASTTLESGQLSFVDAGRITTGASKDLILQAGAGGKTQITDGTTTVDIADGTQALYAVNGATAAKLADGTYAVDATGDIRLSGDITVSGGRLNFGAGAESIDNETANLLKLTTGGNTRVVLGDDAGTYQFQIADSGGNVAASIDSDGKAVLAGISSSGNISPATDLGASLGDATHRFNDIYVANINTSGMSTSGQAVFTYQPLSTDFAQSSVLINPSSAIAGAPLLGVGVAGVQKFFVDRDGAGYFAGNVGIGTSSPAGALHVSGGQCVTGDTLLRARRRRKKKNERGEWIEEEYFEDVRIDQVKPGDEILTLDENTGRLAVSRVNALMDMGVKEIYKLTTAAGKTIRTTANHPYLAVDGFSDERVAVFIDSANFEMSCQECRLKFDYRDIIKSFFGQKDKIIFRYYKVDFGSSTLKRFFDYLNILGIKIVSKPLKVIKQKDMADVHKANFDVEISFDAAMKKEEYDTLILFSGDSDFAYMASGLQKIGKKIVAISNWRSMSKELRDTADVYLNLRKMPFVRQTADETKKPRRALETRLSPALPILSQAHPFVKGAGKWKKVSDLREGQMIAVVGDNGKPQYERIAKIEKLPPEQVYDIEVEGTHNFVGNGIVAHNTYLQGADQLNTSFALRVQDSAAADKFVVTNAGNVGIGTTVPAGTLHVEGRCVTGDSELAIVDEFEENQIRKIQIKDIRPEMEVLSLNEDTGRLEPHIINKLLDMGVKPVFKLTTQSGKTIRTTGNHPYLVRKSEHKISESEINSSVKSVNPEYLTEEYEFADARILWEENKKPALADSLASSGLTQNLGLSPDLIIGGNKKFVKGQTGNSSRIVEVGGIEPPNSWVTIQNPRQATPTTSEFYHKENDGAKWTKLIYLHPGDYIAVASLDSRLSDFGQVLWDKIKFIEYVGEEQVYDIEVEGTHNFVGNGIVAHNTYLMGDTGIGTTSPGAKLDVRGGIAAGTNGTEFAVSGGGNITAGTYNGLTLASQLTGFTINGGTAAKTLILNDNLDAAGVNNHIADTANPHNVTKSQIGLGDVENTALSTWPGTLNITTLGTIGTGTWNGSVISPVYGGTGVANNAANTLAFTGNYSLGLTLTSNTSLTLPASGTLATLDGTETLTNKTLTSPTITTPTIADLIGAKIRPASDSTTALQFTKADGATNVMNIDTANGRVGIGTTSPAESLDVNGRLRLAQTTAPETIVDKLYNVSGNLVWNGVNLTAGGALPSGAEGQLLYNNAGAWAAFDGMYWDDATSRLGIGTTSPVQKLDVVGNIRATGAVYASSGAGVFTNLKVGNTATTGNTYFSLVSNNTEQVRIDDSGNVGIGTTSPASRLHVVGADTSTSTVAQIGGSSGTGLVVLNNGNVGIGMTAPLRPLSFANTAGEKISLYSISATARDYFGFGIEGNKLVYQVPSIQNHIWYQGSSERMRIDSTGNVGIGTTTPGQSLSVNGDQTVSGYLRVGSNSAPAANQSGDLTANYLALGTDAASGTYGRTLYSSYTNTDTAAGAFVMAGFSNIIAPLSNSSSEYRAINFQNILNAASGITYNIIRGGNFENRVRGDGLVTELNGVKGVGLVLDSSSAATAQATNVYGFNSSVYSRPSGSSTATIGLGVGYDTASLAPNSGLTINTLTGFRMYNPVANAITNLIGLDIADLTQGTNNYGIRSAVSSGGNKYNLYLSGTANNYIAGNVGIGTTGPAAKLHVNVNGSIVPSLDAGTGLVISGTNSHSAYAAGSIISGNTGIASLFLGDENAEFRGALRYDNSAEKLSLWSAGSQAITVDSSGNVGIGTTSPAELLDVNGRLRLATTTAPVDTANRLYNVSGNLVWNGVNLTAGGALPSGAEGQLLYNNAGAWTAFDGMYWDDANSRLGIGTTSPDRNLQVVGGIRANYIYTDTAATATNPSVRLASGYGFFSPGLNSVAVSASSTEVMRIDASGNVGIGTTSPAGRLDVLGLSTAYPSATVTAGDLVVDTTNKTVYVGKQSNASGDNSIFAVRDRIGINKLYVSSQADVASYFSTGNVGIGTTSPSSRLHVVGADTSTSTVAQIGGSSGTGLVVLNNGNVGIGTASPGARLEVSGGQSRFDSGVGFTAIDAGWSSSSGYSTSNYGVRLGAKTAGGSMGIVQVAQGATAFPLSLQPYGSNVLFPGSGIWQSTGNVGIGTTAPGQKLTVQGDSGLRIVASAENHVNQGVRITDLGGDVAGGMKLTVANSDAHSIWLRGDSTTGLATNYLDLVEYGQIRLFTGSSPAERMRIDSTGNVGIGTTSPVEALDVNGRVRLAQTTAPATTADRLYNVSGNLLWNGVNLTAAGALPVGTEGQMLYNNAGAWSAFDGLYWDDTTSRMGIGTATPGDKLHVNGGNIQLSGSNNPTLVIRDMSALTDSESPRIKLFGDQNGSWFWIDNTSSNLRFSSGATPGGFPMVLTGTGNVGIGTTAPSYKLDVVGDLHTSATSTFAGRVGIGTTNPAYDLDVVGTIKSSSYGVFGTGGTVIGNGTTALYQNNMTNGYIGFPSAGNIAIMNGNVGIRTTSPAYTLDVNGGFRAGNATSTNALVFDPNTGNIGIGTTGPGAKLDVIGTARFRAGQFTAQESDVPSSGKHVSVGVVGDSYGDIYAYDRTAGSAINLSLQRLGGNVGIGTTDPAEALDVNGRVRLAQTTAPETTTDRLYNVSGNLLWNGVNLTAAGALPVGTEGQLLYNNAGAWTAFSGLYWDDTNSRLGIGTTTPIYKFNVAAANAGTGVGDASLLGIVNTDTTANNTIGLAFGQANLSGAVQTVAGIDLIGVSHADGAQSGALAFATRNAGSWSERLRIDSSGNVGIGTATPGQKLDIQGNPANGEFIGSKILDTGLNRGLLMGVYKSTNGAYDLAGLWPAAVTPNNTNYIFGTTGADADTYFGAPSGRNMHFQVAASTKMYIDSTGNVGIGTATAVNLDVRSSATNVVAMSSVGNSDASHFLTYYGGTSGDNPAFFWKSGDSLRLGPASANNGTGFAERLRIDSTGNVGIGTTSPAEALDVNGRVRLAQTTAPDTVADKLYNVSGNLLWNGVNLTAAGALPVGTEGQMLYNNAGAWSAFDGLHWDDATSRLGIGTTSPIYKFNLAGANASTDVGDASLLGIVNTDTTANNTIGLAFGQANLSGTVQTVAGIDLIGVSHADGAQSGALAFSTRNAGSWGERLRIDPSGNVGIGTAAPNSYPDAPLSLLHVNGQNQVTDSWGTALLTSNGAMGINKGGSLTMGGSYFGTTLAGFGAIAGRKENSTSGNPAGYLQLSYGNSSGSLVEGMRIDSTGNVGIGTTSPGTKLEVVGTGFFNNAGANEIALNSAGTNYGFISNQGTGIWSLGYGAAIGTLATPVLNWNSTGNVGIGTTGPGYKFTVQSEASEATLGSSLLTNGDFAANDFTGWTAGANWSAATGAAVHTAGAEEAISQDITVTTGQYYQIDYTETGDTAGSLTFAIGSASVTRAYWQAASVTIKTTGSTGTQTFSITPTSDYNGTLDNITVKLVTPAATPAFVLLNADGTVGGVQIKAGGSGLNNIFIGSNVGRQNTTGYSNNALGLNSLYSNTTGNNNNALGYQSLYSNTTGYHNNALGYQSLYSNTTGNYNNALGDQSLYSNTSGNYNNALGYYSLYSNTTGYSNNALGREAGRYNQTGSENNYFGYRAGGFGAGAANSHSGTTAMGSYALYNLTTGNYNLGLGYKAGENLTSGSGNVIIGYDIDAPSATASNQLNIGNLIFGTNLDGRNATLSSGNVGIGTAAPAYKLDVNGTFNASATSTFAGNVGIGTTAPTGKLTVRGDSSGAAADLLRLENLGTAAVNSGAGVQFVMNRTTGGATEFGRLDMLATNIDDTAYSGALQFKIAANGLLETVAEFGSANIVLNRPLQVNVAGDTGISYDLQFMNTGVSNIVSNGPLTISAGTIYRADNLTLTTRANEQTGDFGTAATTTATTLTDSGKAWTEDEWIGGTITIVAGAGKGQTQTITDNDATVITVADWDATLGDPLANSVYRLSYAPAGDVLANIANANAIFGGFKVLGNDNGGYAFRVAPDGSVHIGGEGAGESSLFVKQNITAYGGILSLRQLDISSAGTPVATTATSGGSCADSTAYYYKVTAINGNGETTGTAQFTVTTGASGTNINLNTIAWSAVTGATGYKIYRSTENNDWDGDANDQWVDGKVVAAPAITYDDDCAGDTASLVPPTANTTGGKLAINTAGVSPTRRFEVLENTGAAPQMKIISDASNYSEFYVDATGDLSLKLTGSGGDDLILLDENLKICASGDFGSVSCPTAGFTISGTGNLIVENKVIADKFEQICPTGYVWVPGSAKHGTLPGFCVMKYEAKDAGGGVAESKAADAPWTSVTQENARAYCQALGEGYHLVSEAEWMTIAENIAATPINDIDAVAGLQLATGHTDNDPANSLAAGTDPVVSGCNLRLPLSDAANAFDADCQLRDNGGEVYGYSGTGGNFWNDIGYLAGGNNKSQLRVHALSNGNTVWDIAGNVWEWTDQISICAEHPYDLSATTTSDWMEYNLAAGINYQGFSYLRPADDGWSSANGIGRIYTDAGDTPSATRAFRRGGDWGDTSGAGVFALGLSGSPADSSGYIGFRCAR